MPANATAAKDWLPGLLREWAQLQDELEALGYPSATPVWRELNNDFGGEFGPSLPAGLQRLETRGQLRDICEAIHRLEAEPDKKITQPVAVVTNFYRYGKQFAADILGMSTATLYNQLNIGEALIRREMRR